MKSIIIFYLFVVNSTCFSQETIAGILKLHNKQSVSYINVNNLIKGNNYIFLDTREPNEYNVSHVPTAINIGYNNFKNNKIKKIISNKNVPIVVYCTIGIRSEKIGEKLIKLGYTNVQNLYGGILEWKNQNQNVVDANNKKTENVHTFSKEWSQYLKSGTAIYEK